MQSENGRKLLKVLVPRILRAALWGFIMGGELLFASRLPTFRGLQELISSMPGGAELFYGLTSIFVGFEVAIQLTSGTIIRYGLGIARAFVNMVLFYHLSGGGVMRMAMPVEFGSLKITVDFSSLLVVILLIILLTVARNVVQAIGFLAERIEGQT